jgi:hypothetical protein
VPVLPALLFAPLPGAIASVIAWAGYSKPLIDKSRVLKRTLEAGLVTFGLFLIVPPLSMRLFLAL